MESDRPSLIQDHSIVVLPFVSHSSDIDNDYFSDGMTEEIINALSRDEALKVIARTSAFAYKGKQVDVRQIGRQLAVATLLEGSVQRVQDRVRITARLVETRGGTQLWTKNFDRELTDIFALQDEVSQLIADQIREHFGHFSMADSIRMVPTRYIDAYEWYLKGSFHFKRKDFDDIQLAKQYFEAAIAQDSQYAEAYAYLAETYLHLAGFGVMQTKEAHDLARASAERSIDIQPKTARGHKVLAYIYLFYDWDWAAAQKAYQHALECGLTQENEFITYYYTFLEGDFTKAISIAQQSVERDPLHAISHWKLGLCYYFAAQFGEAVRTFKHAQLLDHSFAEAYRWQGLALGKLGQFDKALANIDKAHRLMDGQGPAAFNRLQIQALMGDRRAVLQAVEKTNYLDPCDPAELYTQLDMHEQALDFLEQGLSQRSVMMVSLKHYWMWDPIRSHPRFQTICKQMYFDRVVKIKEPETTANQAKRALMDDRESERYLAELKNYIKEEVYLDPELSLRSLAGQMKLHPNKLSWLINETAGQNFKTYVNSYRLATFKQKAVDPANSHLTLLGLAYESGFNSKTVFNNFFKKNEGQTPRAWLKSQIT